MSTDQKYDSGVLSPNFIDLTAKQPVNQEPIQPNPADQSTFPVAAFNADAQIYEVVDRFVGEMHSIDNVEIMHELFHAWTKRKPVKMGKAHNQHVTYNFLRITTFLTQLHELWTAATVATKLRLDELNTTNAEGGASHE